MLNFKLFTLLLSVSSNFAPFSELYAWIIVCDGISRSRVQWKLVNGAYSVLKLSSSSNGYHFTSVIIDAGWNWKNSFFVVRFRVFRKEKLIQFISQFSVIINSVFINSLIMLEGTLSKWTNVMKGWQYRWFVLDENAGLLSYYTVS